MKTSAIFEIYQRKRIEQKIVKLLNQNFDFFKIDAQWTIGNFLTKNFGEILDNLSINCSLNLARRAMADLAFSDKNGFYYIIDVKTHRLDTHFNMPNLTSVERLARFYENDKNYFVILVVAYNIRGTLIKVKKAHFIPIEFLSWECLTIGALGWGQIQIANSNRIIVAPQTRKKWMLKLCDTLFEFYPSERAKIKERIKYFIKVKSHWLAKKEQEFLNSKHE